MKNGNLDLKSIVPALKKTIHKLRQYVGVFAFLLFAGVYGFMLLRVNTLSNPVVSDSDVISEAKSTPSPRIDAAAAAQLQSLKDNSVSVQTLFDASRNSPFNE